MAEENQSRGLFHSRKEEEEEQKPLEAGTYSSTGYGNNQDAGELYNTTKAAVTSDYDSYNDDKKSTYDDYENTEAATDGGYGGYSNDKKPNDDHNEKYDENIEASRGGGDGDYGDDVRKNVKLEKYDDAEAGGGYAAEQEINDNYEKGETLNENTNTTGGGYNSYEKTTTNDEKYDNYELPIAGGGYGSAGYSDGAAGEKTNESYDKYEDTEAATGGYGDIGNENANGNYDKKEDNVEEDDEGRSKKHHLF